MTPANDVSVPAIFAAPALFFMLSDSTLADEGKQRGPVSDSLISCRDRDRRETGKKAPPHTLARLQ